MEKSPQSQASPEKSSPTEFGANIRNWQPSIASSGLSMRTSASPKDDRLKMSIKSDYNDNDDEENKDDGKKPKKALNWKQYLKDEKVEIDVLNFERNRMIYKMDETQIKKDLNRTRPEDPFFRKESTIQALKDIGCFYCSSNNVAYQQGLLDMVVPFLRMRSQDFKTKQCYAYFASFMRNYFPNILIPTVVHEMKELPHLNAAISYCCVLLNYHAPMICNIMTEKGMDLRAFATPWVMTLFTKGTDMSLVFDIFDKYMAEKDKLFIFYMVVALMAMSEKKIVELYNIKDDDVQILTYLNKGMKAEALADLAGVEKLFNYAKKVKENTPASFVAWLKELGIMKVEILSIQEFNEFLNPKVQDTLEVYAFEVVDYLVNLVQNKPDFYNKHIKLKIIDCRKDKSKGVLPVTIEINSKKYYPDLSILGKKMKSLCTKSDAETHFCLMRTHDLDPEEKAFIEKAAFELRRWKKKYVSVIAGGFESIQKEYEMRGLKMTLVPPQKTFLEKISTLLKK